MERDEKGRFVSARAIALKQEAAALTAQAEELIKKENEPPAWLKSLVITIARELGVTAEEFQERIKIIHPTPADPVITVDGRALVAWV